MQELTPSASRIERLTKLSSTFSLKQALVTALSQERVGQYQCRVLPELGDTDDVENFPWYPSFSPKKVDYQVGEAVWVWVTEDLWIGYVIDRVNVKGPLLEVQAEVFDRIQQTLSALPTDLLTDIVYESCAYIPLGENMFMVWDQTNDIAVLLNTAASTAVALSGPNIFLSAEQVHIPNTLRIGEGESAAVRALELQDILDEIEGHIHVSPVGPVDPAKGADMAPLSAKIARMRQTMEATQLIIT